MADPQLQAALDGRSDVSDPIFNKKIAQLLAMRNNPQIMQLLMSLISGGDPRMGGDLPLGGKAYARGTPQGGNFQMRPGLANEAAGHDAAMNYNEARLQDEEQRIGLRPGTFMDPNMARLLRKR